jgi:ribonuclease PH
LQADAGTRTTAITGGFVALQDAIHQLLERGELLQSPIVHQVAATSVGLIQDQAFLDLNYDEDVIADVDCNVVMNDSFGIIEVQGTAEGESFSRQQLDQIMDLAEKGIRELFALQHQAFEQ